MSRSIKLLIVSFAVIAVAVPVLGQDWSGKGRVQGVVLDQADNPIQGATVTLLRDDQGPSPLTTNKKGAWSYLGLLNGPWTVQIAADGFITSEGTINVNEFGVNPRITINLRPIPEEILAEAAAQESLGHLNKGNELLAAGQPVAARVEFETALADLEEENHPPVLMGIARTYYQEGDKERAEATLRQVLELEPDDVDALKLLSSMLVAAGREDEARTFMDRLPEGELLDADAYLNVGIELYNNGDLDGALVEFHEVVEGFPELPAAYYYRGLVLLAQKKNEEAIADFEKLIELDPDSARAAEAKEFLSYLQPGE